MVQWSVVTSSSSAAGPRHTASGEAAALLPAQGVLHRPTNHILRSWAQCAVMVISSADDLLPDSISWSQWSCPVLCPAQLGHADHLHHPWAAVHTPDGAQSYDWSSQASDRFWILLDQLSPLVTGLQIPDWQLIYFFIVCEADL